MDTDELKHRLGRILAEEEGDADADWLLIEQQSAALLGELHLPLPLVVDEYLRGSERRRQDPMFGRAQRNELVRYLRGLAGPSA